MNLTTTPSIEGRRIVRYLGIVHGEAIVGANLFRDMFAAVRDIVGGRAGAYEHVLGDARRTALDEMTAAATELGASAVVGIDRAADGPPRGRGAPSGGGARSAPRGDVTYEILGSGGSMLMVTASGTAVVLE